MKRCLVTGAGGLIGSQVVSDLVAAGWTVHALSRRPRQVPPQPGVSWHVVDLADDLDDAVLPGRMDAVVFLAQSEHFREFPDRALDIFRVNSLAVLRMLEYARRARAKSFIFGSSGGVYGSGDGEFSEELEIPAEGDLGFYLGTKLCSEILVQNYAALLDVVILRFFFVYGAAQRRAMLVPRLIDSVRDGKPIQLQGNDGLRLNPIHVSDAARAVVGALGLGGSEKINVAGPQILTLRQLGEIIGEHVGQEPKFSVDTAAPVRNLVGDIEKMSRLLGAPKVQFAEGIREMVLPDRTSSS